MLSQQGSPACWQVQALWGTSASPSSPGIPGAPGLRQGLGELGEPTLGACCFFLSSPGWGEPLGGGGGCRLSMVPNLGCMGEALTQMGETGSLSSLLPS